MTIEKRDQINHIIQLIDKDVNADYNILCPKPENVFRFLSIPVSSIKVIILGQDPYPQKGIATGRAFEVNDLNNWNDSFRNPSLQNIVRSAYKARTGDILKFNQIRNLLKSSISIFSPKEIFDKWEKQGVLLLNTALTCRLNEPESHSHIWTQFTTELIQYLHNTCPECYWFIWGNNAKQAVSHIQPEKMIFSYHPSRCNPRGNDFLYGESNCFEKTSQLIDWLGYKEAGLIF